MTKYGERRRWIHEVALQYNSDACLVWPFSLRGQNGGTAGYPALNGAYGHRLLCAMVHGNPPTSKHEASHTCGDTRCMNYRHLKWESHKANCARRTEHGTQTIGERHGMAKLTKQQVLRILKSKATGVSLAAKYNVSTSMICLIRQRKSWKHV